MQDALASGWVTTNSWEPNYILDETGTVRAGDRAIKVDHQGGFSGFSLSNQEGVSFSDYESLKFWVYSETPGSRFAVAVQPEITGDVIANITQTPEAGEWVEITIPLSEYGTLPQIRRINFQEFNGATPTFYYDNIRLVPAVGAIEPIAAPTNLSASSTTINTIELSWTDNSDNESGFVIEKSTDETNWSV